MKKRTVFFRVFVIVALTVFVGVLMVSLLQYTLVTDYISTEHKTTLSSNAKSLANIIDEEMSTENLYLFLESYAVANNYDIFLIDRTGLVIMRISVGNISDDNGKYINDKYTKDVISGEENFIKGDMDGLFTEKMLTFQMPVMDTENENVVGAIFLSTPLPEEFQMNMKIFEISLFSIVAVMILALIMSYTFSANISRPIKTIDESVKKFANGNFSERVELKENDYSITEICDLADSFNNMADDLEKFEEVRMNFISDVSHELRTPMTTISGFIDGIVDKTISEEKKDEYLKIVQSEIKRLSRLVNTFLAIKKMNDDSLEIKPENFELNEVIRLAIINLEQSIERKKININIEFCSELCYVKADIDSIKQVLTNLLTNAVKFTNEYGYISVCVTSKQHEICVSVYNTGCGIPQNELQLIFERFYKVDKSRSLNKEGTGIGLYMVKRIIAAHGKEIEVESKEGEFAKFSFSLDKGKPSQ